MRKPGFLCKMNYVVGYISLILLVALVDMSAVAAIEATVDSDEVKPGVLGDAGRRNAVVAALRCPMHLLRLDLLDHVYHGMRFLLKL